MQRNESNVIDVTEVQHPTYTDNQCRYVRPYSVIGKRKYLLKAQTVKKINKLGTALVTI